MFGCEHNIHNECILYFEQSEWVLFIFSSQNPTSIAVDEYKCEVSKLEEQVKHLKEQLLKAEQGNLSTLEAIDVQGREEDQKKIEGIVCIKKISKTCFRK